MTCLRIDGNAFGLLGMPVVPAALMISRASALSLNASELNAGSSDVRFFICGFVRRMSSEPPTSPAENTFLFSVTADIHVTTLTRMWHRATRIVYCITRSSLPASHLAYSLISWLSALLILGLVLRTSRVRKLWYLRRRSSLFAILTADSQHMRMWLRRPRRLVRRLRFSGTPFLLIHVRLARDFDFLPETEGFSISSSTRRAGAGAHAMDA